MKKLIAMFFCACFCLTLPNITPVAIGQDCSVDVLTDSLPKSNWFVLPGLLRIDARGFEIRDLLLTPVTIECDADEQGLFNLASVLKTGKVVQPIFGSDSAIIWQTVIVWPTWITQTGGGENETCTVTVEDCEDTGTFELNYLPFFLNE